MSGSNEFVYLEGKELKKAGKIKFRSKKMTLVSYKDSSTYHLYNRDSNFIIVSCSININEDKMLTERSNKTADEISVSTNSLSISEIIKTPSSITKLVKTSQIIKSANLDHITSPVMRNREIMNNSLSRALVSKSRHERSLKKKTLIDKIVLVIKILE